MSYQYESVIILNTKGLEGSVDDLVSAVAKEMEAEGAKLKEITQLGRREFAYPLKHLSGGHYVTYRFEGDNDIIQKLRARLRLNEKIHIQHYNRVA